MNDNVIQQIQSIFEDHFKKLGKLPEDKDAFHDIALASELKRVLAIPDRLSYLAKGIISKTVYDVARDHLGDIVNLVSQIGSSDACEGIRQRAIDNVLTAELATIVDILGLKVEKVDECDEEDDIIDEKKNIVKRVSVLPIHGAKEILAEEDDDEDDSDIVSDTVMKLRKEAARGGIES